MSVVPAGGASPAAERISPVAAPAWVAGPRGMRTGLHTVFIPVASGLHGALPVW